MENEQQFSAKRKKQKNVDRNAAENLRLILESMQDHAIIQTDEKGKIILWNSGAEKIFGWSREEVIGTGIDFIFLAEDRENGVPQEEMSMARRQGRLEENRWHLRRDGAIFFASGTMNPLTDETGAVLGYIKILMDQTQKKVYEEQLKTREQEMLNYFMQSPVATVILVGPEFRFLLANPPYEKIMGRKVGGKTIFEAFNKDELGEYVSVLQNVFTSGQPYSATERQMSIPDERGQIKTHWLNFNFYPHRDDAGKIKGIIGIIVDVTDQVVARKVLEENKRIIENERENFYHLFRQTSELICVLSGPEHVFEYVNEAHVKVLGFNATGMKLLEAQPESVEVHGILDQVYQSGETVELREILVTVGATQKYFNITYSARRNLEGNINGVMVLASDMTDIINEKKLREKFVTTLSHDLRTPLTVAKMSTQLLLRKLDDPITLARLAKRIMESMERADKMIRDLLDANLIKAGEKLPVTMEECDLREIAEAAVLELSTIHGERFILHAQEGVMGTWGCGDVRRILENLCSNAIKYGDPNREITIALGKVKDHAEISVHNWGPAIPKQELQFLFEPFKRATSAQDGKHKGWGVGLAFVRAIAEAHGGTVRVESTEDKGTTFFVSLPVRNK